MKEHVCETCPYEFNGERCPFITSQQDHDSPIIRRAGATCPYDTMPCVVCHRRTSDPA